MRTTVGKPIGEGGGPSRRDLLKAGGLGALGLGLGGRDAAGAGGGAGRQGAVILLMMVGGPSQIETFDPKPDAPPEVRGPFRSIPTEVPGVRVVEHLPGIARRMGRLTLIRSLNHDAAPIHETGLQLLGTGHLCRRDDEHPHLGAIASDRLGSSGGLPPFVILPGPIGNTGVAVPRGQSAGPLGAAAGPFIPGADLASPRPGAFDLGSERQSTRDAYGRGPIGRDCLLARRLVEAGARVVVVNMFDTVFGRVTWDAHGLGPFSTLDDYARELLPAFDRAFSTLVDDLEGRGLLASTLVVASGEFGRTPRLNASGGRDHWPGAWSALLAGGGTAGGRVIGATDRIASEPVDRPVAPAELFATMARSLGLDASEFAGASPIAEAFA